MTESLAGKVALITGGGGGIGRAIAEGYAGRGGTVAVVGRRMEPMLSLQQVFPGQIEIIQANVGEAGQSKRLAGLVEERCGRLDTLINNAGLWLNRPLSDTSDEDFARLLATNVTGVLALIRDCLPMLKESRGSVINISSVGARAINVGTALYGGTKAAINHISRTLAVELGVFGIRVNAVAPGFTVTEMSADVRANAAAVQKISRQTALGRLGEVDEIAPMVLLLASDEGRWVTGQVIEVSGGFML